MINGTNVFILLLSRSPPLYPPSGSFGFMLQLPLLSWWLLFIAPVRVAYSDRVLSNLLAADFVYALLPTENLLAPPGFLLRASCGKLSALFSKPDAKSRALTRVSPFFGRSFPLLGPPGLLGPNLLSSPPFLLLALRGELSMAFFSLT